MAIMNRMRENTKTILLILVFAFMATIIIDWGMGGFKSGQKPGVIASVNGVDISAEQFNQMYTSELNAQRQQSGNDPEGYQLQQIENRVFETLVQQQLIAQTIQSLNLYATDDEIIDEIYSNPPEFLRQNDAFKDTNGVFSMAMYQAALNNPAANWGPIENVVRNEIPRTKLVNLLRSTIVITDDEARLDYNKRNEKAKVHYLFYDSNAFKDSDIEISEDEIKSYYNEHKDDYKVVEQRKIDYVLLDFTPTKADTASVYAQAEELIRDAKKGDDFAQLAEIYSSDEGSAVKGGDLGYFAKGAMVKPFEDAAFAAKVGDIVGPVKSQYGLHIIKVVDKKKEKGEEQVNASHILLKFEMSPSTREALLDNANYISETAKESDLATIAKNEGVEVKQTQGFSQDGFIPGVGMEMRLNRWAFRSKVGDLSDVISLSQGYLVASLAEISKEHVQPLDEVKDRISASLKTDKKMELAKAQANAAYEKIKGGETIDDAAAGDSLEVKETQEFTMTGYVAGVGREPGFVGTAFSLDIGEYSAPVKGARGYYIIQLVDKKETNDEDFEKQKDTLKETIKNQKQQRMFSEWIAAVKEKSKIKDYRNSLM